ncbi:uncharacterized protein LOC107859170 [Capsicum annuum]|uniref:uncharacterized protein LOC107859170 n=1 Tax=Capsicum annuum TaxID=4072 RepID=UPI001FB0B096|nr:uncharacterized protein LOC107859170 [Capsicum annuum]
MESTPAKMYFGKSVLVPSVQELAKQNLTNIPARYVRQGQESPAVSAGSAVPVIDIQKLISGDSMDSELQKLHSACQQWGFLQVINHGVTPWLLEDFKREVVELFRLPMEEKKKLWQQEDSFEGFGHIFVVSEEQKLDWSDMFGLWTLPPPIRNVDLFQKLPSKLRDIIEAYCKEIKSLATIILCQLGKALKMEDNEIRDLFSDGMQSMRMNYYPPCPEPDKTIGLSPHSDADALTILLQLNDTEGLQVRKDDAWVPIKPLPNAFIVNIGDMMEIVSNGVYRSIEHRAIVNSNGERLSVATFYNINVEAELGPAQNIMEAYSKEIKSLAMIILCQLGKALRMDEKEMEGLYSDGVQSIRMNYYPPCPEPYKTIGFSPHSDADALTVLFQLNETEGLQVRKDGIWVPIKPLPNALIVNIGDMMEIVSNGVYRSIEHRAIVNSDKERLSVATFYTFNLESELGPKLHLACKDWGFFQLVNHEVSLSLVEKVKSEIKAFFDLPMEEKKKFEQQEGDSEGYGQAFVVSEEQKLDWADILYMITLPTILRKPHLFPMLPIALRNALEQYSAELKKLAMKILYKMANALGMQDEDINILFEEGLQMMRINYYPPCPEPELVMGLCPHSDSVGLTILLQVSEVEGLQIKKNGAWIPVTPLPDAFVVNIGDSLEIVTNGIYKSIEHRAVVNEDKERISIATFFSPKLDGDFGPAPSLLTPQCPAQFRRIGVADYFKGFLSRELVGKSYIDTIRIGNGDDGNN